MKKMLLLVTVLLSLSAVKAQGHEGHNHDQPAKASQPGSIELKESEHDFGLIAQNKPVYYFFEVINTGSLPIKLDNVSASCGCTTPEWSREPIPAGGSQKIKVGYNAAAEGVFEKYITITYNGNASKQVKIKGNVWKSTPGSAPTNQSVQFLKQQIQ